DRSQVPGRPPGARSSHPNAPGSSRSRRIPPFWIGKFPEQKDSIFLKREASRRARELPDAKRFHLFELGSSRRQKIPSFWIGNFPPPPGTSRRVREVPAASGADPGRRAEKSDRRTTPCAGSRNLLQAGASFRAADGS